VLLDGNPVRSCQTEISEIEGRNVETIEGLAQNGKLLRSRKRSSWKAPCSAVYCVPGMILARSRCSSATDSEPDANRRSFEREYLPVLRYVNVLKAVQRAAQPGKEAQ